MEKRLIIAIALSVLIIVSFQTLSPKPVAPPSPQRMAEQAQALQPKETTLLATDTTIPAIEEKELEVETDKYILTFSDVGGTIKSIVLKDYKDSVSGGPMEAVYIKNPRDYLFNISSSRVPGLDSSIYTARRSAEGITYSLRTKDLEIIKKYYLRKSKYGIELEISVKNISASPMDFGYSIIGGAGMNEVSAQDKRFIEVTADVNGRAVGYKRPKIGRLTNPGIVTWSALKTKYFSLILKPLAATRGQFYSIDKDGQLVMGIDTSDVTIQPGSFINNKFIFYAGPSHSPILKEFGNGFAATVNYGFFGPISVGMIAVMRFFYAIVHSWGFSIILLAIFLNIILFPLTMKSFKSMQKMQELHPQMEKLKQQHKDNPQKMNKEVMELYKKYGVNPFSGCLPMLGQMPVFFALYQALMKSIELRNTRFLWIKDLSSPEAVKIPISLPLIGNSINILPLIMVVTMVIQQKISTKTMGSAVTNEQKEQQRLMLILMPIMFGFIFYSMPSGLVLYWVVYTTLSIVEQSVFLKKREA